MFFTDEAFKVFEVEGLDERMAVIRRDIQPIFQDVLERIVDKHQSEITDTLYIHIAQHRRRTKYAPESTWSAISTSKRGYKSQPHLQLGIWGDYVFAYLSMIDQPKRKEAMGQYLLGHQAELQALGTDFVFSTDHTKAEVSAFSEDVEAAIERFINVKKGEFEFGRIVKRADIASGEDVILETFDALFPWYLDLLRIQKEAEDGDTL
jgi:uncharacterized protein YktB (UPF0637 family)